MTQSIGFINITFDPSSHRLYSDIKTFETHMSTSDKG